MSFQLEFRSFPGPDGPLHYARIPWDSETFAQPIYELKWDRNDTSLLRQHLPPLLAALSAERPVLVWTKVGIDDVAACAQLTRQGFYPVETMVELHLALDRFTPVVTRGPARLRLRPAAPADLPRLVSLARTAFHADRFHLDPHLPQDKSNERFARWLDRAMQAAEPVFVYEDSAKKNILGFYHLRENAGHPKIVYLSLAAIDVDYQKLGFGLLLYQTVLLECRTRGYAAAETHISVNNLDVLNVFARLGCSFRNPVMTLHWYLGAAGTAP